MKITTKPARKSTRIITLNTNGIRSAYRKGLFNWMPRQKASVICIQETKAQLEDLNTAISAPRNFFCYFMPAQKRGYSGVALYSRRKPDTVIYGLGWPDFDAEGRYIEARFGRLSIISIYFPSGSSSDVRQAVKFDFLRRLLPVLKQKRIEDRDYILCGDWNIAHKPIDLKNWRSNQKNSGFLPEERAWLDKVFNDLGYIDGFREVNANPDQYTWWSNRGQAWAKNVGWRIDYQVLSPRLKHTVVNANIYKAKRFSDHAPLIMDYDFDLADFRQGASD